MSQIELRDDLVGRHPMLAVLVALVQEHDDATLLDALLEIEGLFKETNLATTGNYFYRPNDRMCRHTIEPSRQNFSINHESPVRSEHVRKPYDFGVSKRFPRNALG